MAEPNDLVENEALKQLQRCVEELSSYLGHLSGCELAQTDVCTCGLRGAKQHFNEAINAALAIMSLAGQWTSTVTANVGEVRDAEHDRPLESTDLHVEGRGISLLANVLAGGQFTYALSVDGVQRQYGTVGRHRRVDTTSFSDSVDDYHSGGDASAPLVVPTGPETPAQDNITKRLEHLTKQLKDWCDCGGEGCNLCHGARAAVDAAMEIVKLRQQLKDVDEALGYGYFPPDGAGRVKAIHNRSYTVGFDDAARIAMKKIAVLEARIDQLEATMNPHDIPPQP